MIHIARDEPLSSFPAPDGLAQDTSKLKALLPGLEVSGKTQSTNLVCYIKSAQTHNKHTEVYTQANYTTK